MNEFAQLLLSGCLQRHPDLSECKDSLVEAFDTLVACHARGGKLLVCGNGGSAADAEHIVGELMNRFMRPRPVTDSIRKLLGEDELAMNVGGKLQQAFQAISLVSQTSLTTAIANDLGAEMVFAQQVYGYGRPGDVVLALSTSGNSLNVMAALRVARAVGLTSIGFTGISGGQMSGSCDVLLRAPSDITHVIQEKHLVLYHALCAMLEAELFA